MWPRNACVIKKLPIHSADLVRNDPDVAEFIGKAAEKLGRKGRFVLKLSGIPQENSVLAEGKSRKLCHQCIEEFERLLIKKGYMECEHIWERLREEDHGEMDYRSDGGGVSHFIVTLYGCRLCGDLKKEWQGDFCGDPGEYLDITAEDIAFAEDSLLANRSLSAALHYKKPAFWVLLAAIAVCAVTAVCFLTNPAEDAGAAEPAPVHAREDHLPSEEGTAEDPAKGAAEDPAENAGAVEPAPVRVWADHYGEGRIWQEEALTLTLPELPDVTFTYSPGEIRAESMSNGNRLSYIIPGMPAWNAFFTDLTGDGVPELCATVSFGSGMVDEHIEVFDAASWKHYALWERGIYDYVLFAEDGKLIVRRYDPSGETPETAGVLRFDGERLTFAPFTRPQTADVASVMGFDVRREDEELVPDHYQHSYIAQTADGPVTVAESFGYELDDHAVDLDGDGVTELVCNCVFGMDLAQRVYVFRRNGNRIERGCIDYEKLDLTAWDDWGARSTAEWYDPASGRILVEYASLVSSAASGTFTSEAGYDAFFWEEYAAIP